MLGSVVRSSGAGVWYEVAGWFLPIFDGYGRGERGYISSSPVIARLGRILGRDGLKPGGGCDVVWVD